MIQHTPPAKAYAARVSADTGMGLSNDGVGGLNGVPIVASSYKMVVLFCIIHNLRDKTSATGRSGIAGPASRKALVLVVSAI
jgi:hypothetical protein